MSCVDCGGAVVRQQQRCKSCADKASYQRHKGPRRARANAAQAMKTPEQKRKEDKAFQLRHHYGLTVLQYETLLADQGQACAVCLRLFSTFPAKSKAVHVDHDHATQRVRGILCRDCNTSIGKLGDSVAGLRRALDYLLRAEQE